jgi:hypothetical protein
MSLSKSKCWYPNNGLHLQKVLFYGTVCFKNVNNYLNMNIYSYLETSDGQRSNLYLNVVHFFITSVN